MVVCCHMLSRLSITANYYLQNMEAAIFKNPQKNPR